MKLTLILGVYLFSALSFGQGNEKYTCDITDVTGEIQIGISYSITVVAEDIAYLDAGTHQVKLEQLVVGGIKAPIFLGEDDQMEFSFFNGNETLLFLKPRGIDQEPAGFRCQ